MDMQKKMDLLLDGMFELKADMKEVKEDIKELKADVKVLKADVEVLKTEVKVLKADVEELKTNVANLTRRVDRLEDRMTDLQSVVENDVNHSIKIIADGHVDLFRKLNEALKIEEEKETFLLRFQRMERDVHRLKQVVFA